MGMMSRQTNLPQIQRILMEFEKESSMMDMKEEMMGDAIDDAMEDGTPRRPRATRSSTRSSQRSASVSASSSARFRPCRLLRRWLSRSGSQSRRVEEIVGSTPSRLGWTIFARTEPGAGQGEREVCG